MLRTPAEGRFQTIHVREAASNQDLKGATADLVLWPVTHEFIQLTQFGMNYMVAPGAVSTPGVVQLWIQRKDNGALAIANALATLSFDSTKVIYGVQVANASYGLNAGGATIPSTRNFPLAVRGDVIVLKLTTQGAGAGAQTCRPWFHFREMPAGSAQG